MKATLSLVTALLITIQGFAQSLPPGFNYQGRLYDPDDNQGLGGPITGQQDIVFRIYDDGSASTPVWAREMPVFLNESGEFNMLIMDAGTLLPGGPTNSLVSIFSGQSSLYLGLQVVGNGDEISPRQQLVTAPYALRAGTVNTAHASTHAAEAGSANPVAPIVVGSGTGGFVIEQVSGGGVLRLDPQVIESQTNLLLNTVSTNAVVFGGDLKYTGSIFGPLEARTAGNKPAEGVDGFIYAWGKNVDLNINEQYRLTLDLEPSDADEGCLVVPVRGMSSYRLHASGVDPGDNYGFYFRALGRP